MSGVELPTDNDAYLRWTTAHPAGYVINIQSGLYSSDARLHRADCRRINGAPPWGDGYIGLYIKICSDSLADLNACASENVGSTIRPCGRCRPVPLGMAWHLAFTLRASPRRSAPADAQPA
jgi:hypothetical protein